MSNNINPDYIPDNFLAPVENQLAAIENARIERANKLSPIQSIFVNHLLECNMDVSAAAGRTGVKVKVAREWVEHEGPVSQLIEMRLAEIATRTNVTVDKIVQALWDEANRMPVDTEDKTASHAARVSALSHLAKYKGMFDKGGKANKANVKVNINVGGNATISGEETESE